ncbi:MAG TPA: hypothetical protein EYO73_11575 [Sulfurimonas sp.]|nr:hypothetical protein [Sulfurimonas sp.]
MKVAVQCESPLLQRSIELFLQNNLSSLKQCDVVIRDKKILDSYHSLYVSSEDEADIKKPFSSSGLYLALDRFYNKIINIESVKAYDEEVDVSSKDPYAALEEKIEVLTQEYKNKLLMAVKDFYE